MDWWYDRAVVRTYLGRFALAIDDATQALALDAQYPEALVARGRGYAGIGRLAEAMTDYNRAAELAPAMADIFVERGLISWNMGDYEHSLADANTLIELEPNRTRGYQRRAQTYLKLEQWDQALADLDRCDAIDPTDFATPTIRGGVYYSSARYAQAAQAFAEGQGRRPDDYGNYSFHAICRIRLGQTQAALAPLSEWISLANNKDLGLMRRGMLYEMLGEYELAIADFDRASTSVRLGIYPNLWSGICLMLTGDTHAATIRFDACSKLVPSGSWEASLLNTVQSVIEPDDLIAQAHTDAQRTEAHYYVGVAALLRGDTQSAAKAFTECAATENIDILETDFALLRQRALQAALPRGPQALQHPLPRSP